MLVKGTDNEFISFCLLCAQEQTIVPENAKKQAATEDIYINKVDKIPLAANAGFGATSIQKRKEWYSTYLKMKYSYFMHLRAQTSLSEYLTKSKIQTTSAELWKEVFVLWDVQEPKEAVVYILRINQTDPLTVHSEFYNTFEEFNSWARCVKSEVRIADEFSDMDEHKAVFSRQNQIDFENVSTAITRVTQAIVKSNELSEKGVIKTFTKSISELFNCEICDYLYVDNDLIRLFATSFEPADDEDFESYLEDNEHYRCGEGISGAIMLGESSDKFFHVGTNNLDCDWRQSPWHTNAYSKFYQEDELHDFWVFPLFVDGELVAAFRVINKKVQKGEETAYWSYTDRLQLLYLAKWFQEFQTLCQKYTQEATPTQICGTISKHTITEKILEDCRNNSEEWLTQDTLDKVIDHLTKIVHRRIEKKQLGCCLIVGETKETELLCSNGGYDNYIIFNNEQANLDKHNFATYPLEVAAESYSIIYPSSGAFVWDESLKFKGVKALGLLSTNEDEPENALMKLTNDHPKTFAFLLERGHNSILIYHDGQLKYEYYLSDYDGGWHIRSKEEMLKAIKTALRISTMRDTKAKVYERVFDTVWWMSYKKIGTMIVIVHPDKIKLLKDNSEEGRSINKPFKMLKNSNMIYDLAMVDGAILMDEEDMVHYGGLHFKYSSPLEKDMTKRLENKGTRHHQAGHIVCSDSEDAAVFTVSENRGIGVFYKKKIILLDA
jgi:DNA integrity scanning protein DisA with diadenylate cyclase activity